MRFFLALVVGISCSSLAFGIVCQIMTTSQLVNDVYNVYDYGAGDTLKMEADIEMEGTQIPWDDYNYGFHWYANGQYANSTWWNVQVDDGDTLLLSPTSWRTISSTPASSVMAEAFIDRLSGPGDVSESLSWLRSH